MKKIFLIILLFFGIFFSSFATSDDVNMDKLINAIIMVESRGNPNAVSKNGACVGAMQIKTILVDDCNQYLKSKGYSKRYTYNDRYDKNKSIEMFHLIQERYRNYKSWRSKTVLEHMIRLWNGGCGYTLSGTQIYYEKVMQIYNR